MKSKELAGGLLPEASLESAKQHMGLAKYFSSQVELMMFTLLKRILKPENSELSKDYVKQIDQNIKRINQALDETAAGTRSQFDRKPS